MQHCNFVSGACVTPLISSLYYPFGPFSGSQSSSPSFLPLATSQEMKMKAMDRSGCTFPANPVFCVTQEGSLALPNCAAFTRNSACFSFHQNAILPSPARCNLLSKSSGSAFPLERSRNRSFSTAYRPPARTRASASTMQSAGSGSSQSKDEVEMISSLRDFDEALASAKSKLVVIEYAASHSINSRRIYPAMVELSRTCPDVVFRLIMGDESEETKELCRREGVEKVPHFIFYKNMEKIHEEEGIDPDVLLGDVLYYGDNETLIQQLHGREDVEALIAKHAKDDKLIVLDVGLKHCGPCVKVYPTVIKLARKMADTTVFARMHGDENDSCMELLREMDVVEVPTFLFIREGKVCGRYVGSGRGELIGEILRYQGVRVTY